MTKVHWERLLFFLTGFILICYPLVYWENYSGDALIHLVFGQNAAHGHLFEFNLGEKSSGESSVGFMLLVAALFFIFPAPLVPIFVKLINYLAWILFLYLFYRILQNKKFNQFVIFSSLLALGLLPGSVYNTMSGMENVLFGLFTISWFYYAIKYSYFSLEIPISKKILWRDIIFAFLLGIGAWLRLEIMPFFAVALMTRCIAFAYFKRPIGVILARTFLSIIVFLVPVLVLSSFIHWQTGMWIQSSVLARTLQGKMLSYHFGPLIFDSKILLRLIAYFPITLFWLYGAVTFFQKKWDQKIDEFFAIFLFTTFIILFTFVTGVAQLGRYMIFLTPFWILIAARGLEERRFFAFKSSKAYAVSLSVLSLALIAVYFIETNERFKLENDSGFIFAIYTPYNIQKYSDELYAKLGRPKNLPVSIAFGEVDIRYKLDNRFKVRCLDGRIDQGLLKFFRDDSVDYIGFLKENNIPYISDDFVLPSYKNTLYISKLAKIKRGESIETEGLRFTNIAFHYFKIDPVTPIS